MMRSVSVWKQELADGTHTSRLAALYCCAPEQTPTQAARYAAVLDGLETTFGSHTAPEPQIHPSMRRSVPCRAPCFRLTDKPPPPRLDFLSNQQSPVQSPFQFPDVS